VLRHVVLIRWKPETSDAQKQAVREELAALPAAIPEIRSYQFGDDATIVKGNFDFAIVADFENVIDFQTYAAHEAHQKLIAEHIRPILEERAAVQYAL
jgi:hypothetical protein